MSICKAPARSLSPPLVSSAIWTLVFLKILLSFLFSCYIISFSNVILLYSFNYLDFKFI
jgi:hypothetical protein